MYDYSWMGADDDDGAGWLDPYSLYPEVSTSGIHYPLAALSHSSKNGYRCSLWPARDTVVSSCLETHSGSGTWTKREDFPATFRIIMIVQLALQEQKVWGSFDKAPANRGRTNYTHVSVFSYFMDKFEII